MTIIIAVLTFFLSALALKLSLSVMGQPARRNEYGTALTVSASLSFLGLLLSFVPFFGWLIYAVLWVAVVRGVYELSIKRSVGVALLLVLIRAGLIYLLGFVI